MDTVNAMLLGRATSHRERKVFDWIKAAEIIRDRKPQIASAGLRDDWGCTGGTIYQDGKPVPVDSTYTFLASTWATPEIDIDGEVVECYRMQSEVPDWNAETYWPIEALAILIKSEG